MKLKELRIAQNKSQKDVADDLGFSPVVYSRYETGNREPSLEGLKKLADYFEVSIDYLLGRSNVNTVTITKPATQYTPAEDRLVATYRSLDDWGRGSVDATLQREYERVSRSKPLTLAANPGSASTSQIREALPNILADVKKLKK